MPARPFDKGCTPQPSSFRQGLHPPNPHDLERPPKWTRVGPPQPFTTWSGHPNGQGFDPPNPSRLGAAPQMDKGLTPPPTLHDLERPPEWTRVGPPQPFTTWRAFLSRKLTADFPLPNSAYNGLSADPGVPPILPAPGKELHPPNPTRLGGGLPNGQGLDPPALKWTRV